MVAKDQGTFRAELLKQSVAIETQMHNILEAKHAIEQRQAMIDSDLSL
jgi:hypothetical protein